MRRAAVTGAAGFIGSHLAELLLDEGYEVLGIDDMSYGRELNLQPLREREGFHLLKVDIRDATSLREALVDVEEVYHQAAIASVPYSVEHPEETDAVNRIGTRNVLEAAVAVGARKVVLASSAAVYGNDPTLPKREPMEPSPESPYAEQKLACEQLAAEFSEERGLPAVALRYFNVYGPRQDPDSMYAAAIPKIASRIISGQRPIVHGDGEQTRDFIHVGDVAAANLLVMSSSATGVYNVGGGEAVSINQLVSIISSILDSDLKAEHEPSRPGDVRHSRADVSRLREMGFSPRWSLEEGLRATLDWLSSQ